MENYSYIGAFIIFGIPLLSFILILVGEVKDKIEKKKPENQQYYYIKNIQADDIPSFKDDVIFCEENKQSIEALMDEGMLSKKIASYVLRIILYTDSWHKSYIGFTEKRERSG